MKQNTLALQCTKVALKAILFFGLLAAGGRALGQQTNKIQEAIDAIKAANYCEDQDYHTDGQRVVWVKSYKRWTPGDFAVMKKDDPSTLKFLAAAAQHERYDVLEQLLPNYYREHGGVKAFAADAIKEQSDTQ